MILREDSRISNQNYFDSFCSYYSKILHTNNNIAHLLPKQITETWVADTNWVRERLPLWGNDIWCETFINKERPAQRKSGGLGHSTCAKALQRNKQSNGCSWHRKAETSGAGAMLRVLGSACQGLAGCRKALREYSWCNGKPLEAFKEGSNIVWFRLFKAPFDCRVKNGL